MSTATPFQRVAYQGAAALQGLAPPQPRTVFTPIQICTATRPNTIILGMPTADALTQLKTAPLDAAEALAPVPPTPATACTTTLTFIQTPPNITFPTLHLLTPAPPQHSIKRPWLADSPEESLEESSSLSS